jgi:hypothetical protein
MGRECRRVPKDWVHPEDKCLHGDYAGSKKWWDEHPQFHDDPDEQEPDPAEYMPQWAPEECTHYQMYETCTEGSPISPVMGTPEELAQWLADNNASSFGDMTATYEQWLAVCRSTTNTIGLVGTNQGLISGVEAASELLDAAENASNEKPCKKVDYTYTIDDEFAQDVTNKLNVATNQFLSIVTKNPDTIPLLAGAFGVALGYLMREVKHGNVEAKYIRGVVVQFLDGVCDICNNECATCTALSVDIDLDQVNLEGSEGN